MCVANTKDWRCPNNNTTIASRRSPKASKAADDTKRVRLLFGAAIDSVQNGRGDKTRFVGEVVRASRVSVSEALLDPTHLCKLDVNGRGIGDLCSAVNGSQFGADDPTGLRAFYTKNHAQMDP